jgi:hypothetical protein
MRRNQTASVEKPKPEVNEAESKPLQCLVVFKKQSSERNKNPRKDQNQKNKKETARKLVDVYFR